MFFHVDLHTSLVASPLKSCSTLNINALIFCSPLLFNIYVDSKKVEREKLWPNKVQLMKWSKLFKPRPILSIK